jgi:hypothetical protein
MNVLIKTINGLAVANIRSPANAAITAKVSAIMEMKIPNGIKIAIIANTRAAIPNPFAMTPSTHEKASNFVVLYHKLLDRERAAKADVDAEIQSHGADLAIASAARPPS